VHEVPRFNAGFDVTVEIEGPDLTTIRVTGEIDFSNANQFQAVLTGLLVAGTTRLVLDAAGISFMDSAGLRGLMLAARLDPTDRFTVSNPSAAVCELLKLTGIFFPLERAQADPSGTIGPVRLVSLASVAEEERAHVTDGA
jgi:anti-sigma B factor antagonist